MPLTPLEYFTLAAPKRNTELSVRALLKANLELALNLACALPTSSAIYTATYSHKFWRRQQRRIQSSRECPHALLEGVNPVLLEWHEKGEPNQATGEEQASRIDASM